MNKKKKPLSEKYLGMPLIIDTHPYAIDKDRGENNIFKEANDNRIVVDTSNYSPLEIVGAVICFIVVFYISFYEPLHKYNLAIKSIPAWVDGKKRRHKLPENARNYAMAYQDGGMEELKEYARSVGHLEELFFGGTVCCSIFLYWGYVASKRCRDKVIFDRNKSTVTYRHTFGLRTTVAPFSEILFQRRMMSFYNTGYMLGLRLPGTVSWAVLSFGYPEMFISLYVWYMDKNRPLPPGDEFDEYREADYLRRKEEGFPLPLYRSMISTPEWSGAEKKYGDKGVQEREKLMINAYFEKEKKSKKKSSKRRYR